MANVWQEKPFIDEPQFDAMAGVLEAKHGQYAAMVADFFSAAHAQNGDKGRAAVWADVAERVRERQYERLLACPD